MTTESEFTTGRMRARLATPGDVPHIVALALANSDALFFEESDVVVIESAANGRLDLEGRTGTTYLTVVEDCCASPCGFMLSIQYDNLRYGFASELYLMAVQSQSRRNGAGKCLVADALARLEISSKCTCAIARTISSTRLLTGVFGFEVLKVCRLGSLLGKCGKDCAGTTAHKPL